MTNQDDQTACPTEPHATPAADPRALQAILERASEIAALVGRDMTIRWISPGLMAAWGYTQDSVIGTESGRFAHPDDVEAYLAMLRRVAEVDGAHDTAEVRMHSADGAWRWLQLRVTNLLGEEGVDALVVVALDIDDRRRAQDELERRDEFYRAVFEGATDVAVVCDADTTMRWVGPSVQAVCGHDPVGILGTKLEDLVHPEDRPAFQATLDRIRAHPGAQESVETRLLHADGLWRWSQQRMTNMLDVAAVGGLVFNNIDITDRRTSHEQLQKREQLLQLVLEVAHDGVWVLGWDGHTRFANPRLAELLGLTRDALLDRPIEDVLEPTLAMEIRDRLVKARAGIADDYELHVRGPEGAVRVLAVAASPVPPGYSAAGPDGGTVARVTDITERRAYEEALHQQAFRDGLTQLPNRALLEEQRRVLAERLAKDGEHFSYLLCDIDGLKLVNDALGSDQGDEVIREVARRLADGSRAGDTVARTTGDQFVVLCPGAESFQAQRIARDLIACVQGPLEVGGTVLLPTISVGAASTSDVVDTALASAADAALFRAKQGGRGSVAVFDAAAPKDHRSMLELLADLREAVSARTLELHYQPVLRLGTDQVVGAEALLRWDRPGHGAVPPSVFIPLAEDNGLIVELGAWSLQQACHDAMGWPGELSVAVNLSARQLAADIVSTVRAALADSGLPPERLWLEVTETAMFADVPSAAQTLAELGRLGVQISLDDFGTGYSSMAYLRDFPVHALKIDRSFVAGLGTSADDSAIVATLISLATSLNLWVIAEGVETPRQLSVLSRLGCDYAQGYLWSKAVPSAEFLEVVAQHELQRDLSADPLPRRPRARHADVQPDVHAQIMAMHRQGASPSSIAAALNREPVPAPGGKRWHYASVAHVISAAPKRRSER
jgi:diguanylate cyclase (GGDEF)-like protein/PAS domain S-box-containing protein